MLNPPLHDPIWVADPDALKRMVEDLTRQKYLAVDTESNSLYVYREQVCLIQFSTGKNDYLVDPLAFKDLSPLSSLFADPEIEKIFHAAEYDLICLKRDFGVNFTNIFDTMFAGRVLGWASLGLASMLNAEFNIVVSKRYQRANWGRRPLPPPMLAYARLDTYYLIPLRHRLHSALEAGGRLPLAQEDFNRLCNVRIPPFSNGTNHCWRVAGKEKLSPGQMAVLQELCRYRDKQARKANLPPFKILSNKALIQITLSSPRSVEDLYLVNGLSSRNIKRHRGGLLKAVDRGLRSKPLKRTPNNHRIDEQHFTRIEILRAWRKQTAQIEGVPSDVILPRDVLLHIASVNPDRMEELAPVMVDLPWRIERFGQQILNALGH